MSEYYMTILLLALASIFITTSANPHMVLSDELEEAQSAAHQNLAARLARSANPQLGQSIASRPSHGQHSLDEKIEHWPSHNSDGSLGEQIESSPSRPENRYIERKIKESPY